ncbi:MAG: type II toxin-antitoxin system VapC family toxin [Candidatus Roizmanbacteria bacterium]|nr:type II toxin-antitoxin system VapC family toxin [Candidatus Roizmanbacteria bacterium]
MQNIVIDTSVAMKWFFPETGFKKALELKEKQIKNEISMYSRDLFIYEFTSAFKNYSSVAIEKQDFSLAVSALMSLKIKFLPLKFQETSELFLLAKKLNISIYDGSFLLLARSLKAPLYTADRKLFIKGKGSTEIILI